MSDNDVLDVLRGIAEETLSIPAEDIDDSAKLLEMGLDSLILIKLGQRIERQFGVELKMAWFFKNTPSLTTLADHVVSLGGTISHAARPTTSSQDTEAHAPDESTKDSAGMASDTDEITSMFTNQIAALETLFEEQFAVLEGKGSPPKKDQDTTEVNHDVRGFRLGPEEGLTPEQESFIDSVVTSHVARTRKSKEITQKYRRTLADWKNSLSFRARLKETVYPMVANGSNGARFTDVDGNEYIDIALGMGVNYMGHRHPVVTAAVEDRLQSGFELGPQCNMTGSAAEKVAALIDMERVCFCNTGSEAVMVGLRLARAKTKKKKVAIFNGAYHGIFDGVLGVAVEDGVDPLSPGTPPGMVEDIVMLDYDSPASLKAIEEMGDELAAVLVEPVQSRRSNLQPQTFLRRLRRLTSEKGIALIFDEMVNGFRIAPGGAQEYFGIRADIALYGKTIGGGLPIGVIAGSAEYLDMIDGGFWQFGDDSLPSGDAIVFGGTFCRHPFAMEAVSAVADYMLDHGPALQDRVNGLAAMLADDLNLWFQDEQVPMRIVRFGSQFKFDSYGQWSVLANPIELDLFFLLLGAAGIYVWERRTCCLSVAHTEDDIKTIISAVKDAVTSLRKGGFLFRLERGAPILFHDATSVQKRIFAAMQHTNGQAPYHMPAAWRIEGNLDVGHLEICIGEIIKRHECLRSGFHLSGGRLVRSVVDEPRFFVERINPEGRSSEQIIADFLRPFDLEQPPLIRLGVAPLEDGGHLVVFDSLHIVVDGIALATFTRDLNALYNGKEPPRSGATYTQYEDFMRAFEASDTLAAHQAYWTEALKNAPAPVAFPRRSDTSAKSLHGGHVRTELPKETMHRIRKAAAACGVTPYMFMVGIYSTFLRSLAGVQELVIGVATTGRPEERFDETVGMFVNTLPLRLSPDTNASFKAFLENVRDVCADAYEHQDIPYELMTSETGDVVGTMFTYEVADDRRMELSGLNIEELTAQIPGSMFDFSLDAIEKDGVLHLDFEFDTRAIDEACVTVWAECFSEMVNHVCADPNVLVGNIPFRSAADGPAFELAGLQKNHTHKQTVIALFDDTVAATPSAVAVIDGNTSWTYADLDKRSRQIAGVLAEKYDVGPERLVAVSAQPSASTVATILGILRSGGAFLPLEHDAPPSRTNRILNDADITLLITDDALLDSLEAKTKTSIQKLADESETRAPMQTGGPDPASLAYVIYTSGSTGTPKGCEIEHVSLFNYLDWAKTYYFSERTAGHFCLTSAIAFDMSLMTLFVPLCLGTTLRIPPADTNPADALALALSPDTETDVLNLTPSHVRMIAELGLKDTNVKLTVVGGEALRIEDVMTLLALNPDMEIFNEYGPTETTVGCTTQPVSKSRQLTVGKPIFNTIARIVDTEGRAMPPGAWGELCIGGAGLARGYRNMPDRTREQFVTFAANGPRFYRTGDMARVTIEGSIELAGRMDDQIKIGGHRIEPGEIESILATCKHVDQAAVVFDGTLTAFLVGSCSKDAVKRAVSDLLPSYMMPQRFVIIEEMPVVSSGKIDRRTLEALAQKAAPADTAADSRQPASKALALLRELSGNSSMKHSDNFFACGGNSLDAVAVVARCRQELGINVGLREFFSSPTADTIDRSAAETRPIAGLSHTSAQSGIPQTPGQQQIWLASQESSSAYNMTETFFLDGPLDSDALKTAFCELTRRHEILRTTFREYQGELLQDIQNYSPQRSHFEEISLSGNDADIADAVRKHANKESLFQFDLATGPLMRVILLTLDSERHYCLLNIHHIITDGWSASIMLDEVSRLYRRSGSVLSQPEWQYRDFAAWHANYMAGSEAKTDLSNWKRRLEQPITRTSLPGRKSTDNFNTVARPAESVPLVIGTELVNQLDALAREHGATLFMALLAGLTGVLHQRTSQNDITVGTPSAGRVLPELETMPGYFLNTLPLRLHCSSDTSFRELLRRASACASDAFAHQLYPFDKLASQFDGGRADGRNPLFDVMLILQNTTDYAFDLRGIRAERFYSPRARAAKFELMIELEAIDGGLSGIIEFDASRYDLTCIERLATDYVKTLQTVVKEPDAPVASLFALLSGEDDSARDEFMRSLADVSEDF